MTIEAKIILDSVAMHGGRLTTMELKYPRFIHSEFMTHRDFSRNASSSRAIPIEKQIQMVIDDPAVPLTFRKNQKGMQAGEVLPESEQKQAAMHWQWALESAITQASCLNKMGVHKQYANRLLEPFAHITVLVSSTRWANFFALRHHSEAQPEIAELARKMWEAYQGSVPQHLAWSRWHLPFITDFEQCEYDEKDVLKMSVARCARVSYLNHDGTNPTAEGDFKLYDRLLASQPLHASPAEHQGVQSIDESWKSGNFNGWIQYRKVLDGEYITKFEGPLG